MSSTARLNLASRIFSLSFLRRVERAHCIWPYKRSQLARNPTESSPWLGWAARECTMTLQARVSAALEALPRGREPSPPGERFRRTVLSAMPDIEAMELVEQFFALGAKVVGTTNAVGIFLAGCRECLPEWELQAHGRRQREDNTP